ncbi:hypothetical protein BDU57DRAFT_569220, partial [Ampelomyces quisqualis]
MPPKRKGTEAHTKISSKRPRRNDSSPPAEEHPERVTVRWALPTTDHKTHERDESEDVTKYAQPLFNQAWDTIQTTQRPFEFPAIRTPIFKAKGKDLDGSDQHQSSRALQGLFNTIKHATERAGGGNVGPYSRHAFEQTFNDANNDSAVVASGSLATPILALHQDYQVEITIRDDDRTQTARVHFLRRIAPTDDAEGAEVQHGYFIDLPRGTRITVNGRTYVNKDVAEDGEDTLASPFIIGPLNRYTIIELLSQPIFFFRGRADLGYTAPLLPKSSANSITQDELDRRDTNGDVDAASVALVWTPLQQQFDPPAPESEADPEPEYDDTWTANGQPITDPRFYLQSRLYGTLRDRYNGLVSRVLLSINGRQEPVGGFSVDLNQHILRPGRTLITTLLHPLGDHHVVLVFRVQPNLDIMVNVLDVMAWRTTRDERYAIHNDARQLLLDRNWWRGTFDSAEHLTAHFPENSHWVDCAQHDQEGPADTYTILNALALVLGLELHVGFCDRDDVNNTESMYDFNDQAHLIFEAALADRLHWKLLYAFFMATGYANRPVETNDLDEDPDAEGDETLPPRNRRFDFRVRPFEQLLTRQRAQDENQTAPQTANDIVLLNHQTFLHLEPGLLHTNHWPSDNWSAEFRLETVRRVAVQGTWRMIDDEDEENTFTQTEGSSGTQNGAQSLDDPAAATQPQDPAQIPAASNQSNTINGVIAPSSRSAEQRTGPRIDVADIPEDFNSCEYFQGKIAEITERGGIVLAQNSSAAPVSSILETFNTIGTVIHALHELHRPGQSITLVGPGDRDIGAEDGLHDQNVLYLHNLGGHIVLLLFQVEENEIGRHAVAHVIDSAPGVLSLAQRQQLYLEVHDLYFLTDTGFPETFTWIFGPQQIATGQSHYFAILNAWSIALNLKLNTTDFVPGESFFVNAAQLIEAARQGQADWSLIWAFLRCNNYVVGQEAPQENRRFTRTVGVATAEIDQHKDRKRRVRLLNQKLPGPASIYSHFSKDNGLPHNKAFRWDDLEREEIEDLIPALKQLGRYNNNLSRTQIRNRYAELRLDQQLPCDPCEEFQRIRTELLNDEDIHTSLENFRATPNVHMGFGEWLDDEEVSLAIAAVTCAVTSHQPPTGGFGFVPQFMIQWAFEDPTATLPATVRPGRPMLLPLHIQGHFVLMVIRMNDDRRPEFSVMDSKGYHLDLRNRRRVHDFMFRIARDAQWHNYVCDAPTFHAQKPAYTTWIPSSQQPSDNECSYYAIMNAWSLALGLQPDPDAIIDWSDQFFSDLLDVVHLARIGQASWLLIYTFLRCRRFIRDGIVPMNRRFQNTADLRDSSDSFLGPVQDMALGQDQGHFIDQPDWNEQELHDANVLQLPSGGRRHNVAGAFPSDRWDNELRFDQVHELARKGKLDLDFSAANVRRAATQSRNAKGVEFRNQLREKFGQYRLRPRGELIEACRQYLREWHDGRNLIREEDPCATSQDAINFYKYVFTGAFLGKELQGEAFQNKTWNEAMDSNEQDHRQFRLDIYDSSEHIFDHDSIPQQSHGGWQCGPHTVINGWILAMGLHPNPDGRVFTDAVYRGFHALARAAISGLLDWQTLVAWFFCRRLTVERKFTAVPRNRRFSTTRAWASEPELDD